MFERVKVGDNVVVVIPTRFGNQDRIHKVVDVTQEQFKVGSTKFWKNGRAVDGYDRWYAEWPDEYNAKSVAETKIKDARETLDNIDWDKITVEKVMEVVRILGEDEGA